MAKIGFLTFANTGYMTPTRILQEANDFGVFDFVKHMTENDIPDFISKHHQLIRNSYKGYGYWIWKPKVILDTLLAMNDGDILVYADAGTHLNIHGMSRFHEYLDLLTKKHMVVFSTNLTNGQTLIKQDAISYYFPEFEDRDKYKRYCYSGVLMMKKTNETVTLIQEWLMLCENYSLLTPFPSTTHKDCKDFAGNDCDNALFNLCIAKHNIHALIYPDETCVYNTSGEQNYVTGDWSSLNKFPFHTIRLRPGNPLYTSSQQRDSRKRPLQFLYNKRK